MAVAVIMEFEGETTDLYDRSNEAMGSHDWTLDEIPGFLVHAVGETDGSLFGVEIWESQEAFENHVVTNVMPVVKELGAPEPKVRIIPLHRFLK